MWLSQHTNFFRTLEYQKMVWYNPLSWFSRSAQTVLANANTNVLKNALRNYIKAVNSLKPNGRTNQAITNILNQANMNATNKRVIRNRLANGIAKAVAASRRGVAQAAAAVESGAPEGPSAGAVNNATAKIENLNIRISQLADLAGPPGTAATPANLAGLYMAKKYNNSANRAINTAGKYASIWAAINGLKTSAARPLLNAVLAKTTNQKLQANINNRNKSEALMKELKNTAAAVGVNLKNKNVNAALTRIVNHESRLPVKAGATATNRSRLNAALAKSMNQQLQANIANRNQANALMAEVRNAAQAAGVNLTAPNVNAALSRIIRHQSSLNP